MSFKDGLIVLIDFSGQKHPIFVICPRLLFDGISLRCHNDAGSMF